MILEVTILTVLIEILTILSRILYGSTQEKFRKNKSKYKVRIHHGYWGIALIILYYFFVQIEIIGVMGYALLITDAIHHFIVLPIWVGKTEFP